MSGVSAAQGPSGIAAGGTITVRVAAAGGSDTATATRPATLTNGTYTSEPYATLAGALSSFPKDTTRGIVNVDAGASFTGAVLAGHAMGKVDIVGTWSAATVATGAQTGTAGAGSGGTVLNKPTAAANWTASDLVGKIVRITGGGGYLGTDAFTENVLRIKSNTATQAVLEASMTGLDATSTFEIVQAGSVFTGVAADAINGVSVILGVLNCTADIRMRRIRVDNVGASATYGFATAQSQFVDLVGCEFKDCYALPTYSYNLRALSIYLLRAYFYAYAQVTSQFSGFVGVDSSVAVERGVSLTAANIWLNDDFNTNAVAIKHVGTATLGGSISNCTGGTPVLLENVHEFAIAGTLAGTNASVVRGVQIQGGGQYQMSGATIAGSGSELAIESDQSTTWASVSANGSTEYKGNFVVWGSGASVDLAAVRTFSGVQFNYGFSYPLGNAYKDATAHAGGGQANATVVGYQATTITTCATAGDSLRLLSSSDATITGGLTGYVWNNTATTAALFPPSGKKIYLAGVDQGANNSINITAGKVAVWRSDTNGNYLVIVS